MKKLYYRPSLGMTMFGEPDKRISGLLDECYGGRRATVHLYDDYWNENFVSDGYVYYPMGVKLGKGEPFIHWIRWKTDGKDWRTSYAYGVDLESAGDTVPEEFVRRMQSRKFFFDRSKSFPFAYTDEWETCNRPAGCEIGYSPDRHIEMQLLNSFGEQLTEFILDISPREDLIGLNYWFSIGNNSYNKQMYDPEKGKWIFSINFGAYGWWEKFILVESDEPLRGSVLDQKIEIPESLYPDIYEQRFKTVHAAYTPPDPSKYKEFISQGIIDYINQYKAGKYRPYYS